MKKLTLTLLAIALATPAAKADINWKEKLIDYGLPCLVSFVAGSAMAEGSKNQMAIGTAGCLGIGTATYLNERRDAKRINDEDMKRIEMMVDSSVQKKSDETQKGIDSRLQTIESAQKSQLDEMRSIVREVLAERLLKLEDSVKAEVNKKLESGEFMPQLEKNLSEAMKKEVMIKVQESQKGIVEKCVEKTIQEVTAQPIGVRENQDGVQQ